MDFLIQNQIPPLSYMHINNSIRLQYKISKCKTMKLHQHNKKTEKQIAEISNGPSFKSLTAFQKTYEKLYKRGLTNKALGG
jgi:hypothetical protein